jgi:hypothetical protein
MFLLIAFLAVLAYVVYHVFIVPSSDPLRELPGPRVRHILDNHLYAVLECVSLSFQ